MKKLLKQTIFILSVTVIATILSLSAFAAEKTSSITLSAVNFPTGTNLTWTAAKNVSYYKVYKTDKATKKTKLIAKTKSLSYTDESVTAGKSYSYNISPVYKSAASSVKSNTVLITRVEAPVIETARNATDGIKVIWSAARGASGYLVYRRISNTEEWTRIAKTDADTLNFTDKKANTTDTYTYMVKGFASGSPSCESNLKKWDFLQTPKISQIKSNKTCVSISWTKVKKATSYQIFRKSPSDADFVLYKTVKSDTLQFLDKNVRHGVSYGYIVRAVDKKNIASGHYTASYCTFQLTPEITQVTNATDGVKLTWTKISTAQSYELYRKYEGESWVKIVTTKNTFFTDKTATQGKKCVYTVRAVCDGVKSAYNKQGADSCYLAPPSGLRVATSAAKANTLSWNKSNGATNYNIYRKSEKDSTWKRIARVSGTSYTDKSIKTDVTYKYYVRAYIKTTFKSAASNVISSKGIDTTKKLVAVTYDDGPSNIITNRVLDTLEKYNSKATFFVLGTRIDGNYQPLQRAVKLGCEIGNHTYSHINLPSSDAQIISQEISGTDKLVKKYTGVTPKIARAPGGSTSEYSSQLVGKPFIYWSVDTRDWESRDAAQIIAHVKSETRDGSIILMHDLYEATAEATEIIIPWLIKEGYQLVTVSELMQCRGIKMQNGVTYYSAYR